jgi:Uma2 family endonuclease
MGPIGPRHMQCVNRLTQLISRALPDWLIPSVQNPVRLSDDTEPQPDLTVLHDRHCTTTPTAADTLSLIEVADSTLAYDRGTSAPLYAAGIPEVWSVDLAVQTVERYTDPHGSRYRRVVTVASGETITSATLPALALSVAAILS